MYYSHSFYRLLQRAYRVTFNEDVVIIIMNETDDERRVTYAEMSELEARACLHYIGVRIRRMQEELRKL